MPSHKLLLPIIFKFQERQNKKFLGKPNLYTGLPGIVSAESVKHYGNFYLMHWIVDVETAVETGWDAESSSSVDLQKK